jgi:hypothetical protein
MKNTKEKNPRVMVEEDFIRRYQKMNKNGIWSDHIKLMKARLKILKQIVKLDLKNEKIKIRIINSWR